MTINSQLAQLLAQQEQARAFGQQVLTPTNYETPATALARVLGGYVAGRSQDSIAAKQDELTNQKNEAMRNALMNIGGQPTREAGIQALLSQSQYLDPTSMSLASALLPPAPKQPEPFTLSEGQTRYSGTGDVLASGPQKQPKKTDRQVEAESLYPNDLEAQRRFIQESRKPANISATATAKGETKFQEELGKSRAKRFTDIQDAGEAARNKSVKLERLASLLDQVETTGTGAGTIQALKKTAKTLGIDLASLGITDDTGQAEAAQALSSEMALELRNPAGGAGMPGAMSDKDREFLQAMNPGLGTTPEGRKLMVETQKRLAKRNQEIASLAREYLATNKTFDEGFFEVLANHAQNNPLFEDLRQVPEPQQEIQPGDTAIDGNGNRIQWDGSQWQAL